MGGPMRYRLGGLTLLGLLAAIPAYAQDAATTKFVARIQESYRTAKNDEEVKSVTAYCNAKIGSLSFKERDRLSVQAIKLLEANKVEEANVLFKRVNDLEELDQ